MTLRSNIAAIQARLDKSTSDPKWLNDALADLAQEVDQLPDMSGDPGNPLLELLQGSALAGLEYADVCAAQALTGLVQRWEGDKDAGDDAELIRVARADLHRLCTWATIAGQMMADIRRAKKASEAETSATNNGFTATDAPAVGDGVASAVG